MTKQGFYTLEMVLLMMTMINRMAHARPTEPGTTWCLSGQLLAYPRDAQFVQKCGTHQSCYLDLFVTSTGYRRYNSGCRGKSVCSSLPHNLRHVRRTATGDTLTCSVCCDSQLCNQQGCGTNGFHGDRGPVCYSCEQQSSPQHCNQISVCNQNQVCRITEKVVNGDLLYTSYCAELTDCREQMPLVGRDLVFGSCARCCDTDLCNIGCENRTLGPTTTITSTQPKMATATTTSTIIAKPTTTTRTTTTKATTSTLAQSTTTQQTTIKATTTTLATPQVTITPRPLGNCRDDPSCPYVLLMEERVCSMTQLAQITCPSTCNLCPNTGTPLAAESTVPNSPWSFHTVTVPSTSVVTPIPSVVTPIPSVVTPTEKPTSLKQSTVTASTVIYRSTTHSSPMASHMMTTTSTSTEKPTPLQQSTVTATTGPCVDKINNCVQYGYDHMCGPLYKLFAVKNCAAFCGLCRTTGDQTLGSTSSTPMTSQLMTASTSMSKKPTSPEQTPLTVTTCISPPPKTSQVTGTSSHKMTTPTSKSAMTEPEPTTMVVKTDITTGPCVDKVDNCVQYGYDHVCGPLYRLFAEENCAAFCGLCHNTESTSKTTFGHSSTTDAAGTDVLDVCEDKMDNCAHYGHSPLCQPLYHTFALTHCREFCGLCH